MAFTDSGQFTPKKAVFEVEEEEDDVSIRSERNKTDLRYKLILNQHHSNVMEHR
jgi:hypothetical protein